MTPFLQVPRVIFDHGAVRQLPAELAILGVRRPLILTDQGLVRAGALDRLLAALPAGHGFPVFDHVPENPTVAGVHAAIALYRDAGCDGVVALGGGSVLDSGKGVSVLAGHPGPLNDYMGHPERITHACAPLIAIPTTAGTGSEASRGSGIHPDDHSRAIGLNSAFIVPSVAICDPDFTATLPPRLVAATGMDALSHCIEGFLATPLNPMLDVIALDGAKRVVDWIERAVADPADAEARWHMMLAALAGGMAIPKGLGPIHALAGTMGDQGLHHGLLVTLAMPGVLRLSAQHVPEKMRLLAEALNVPSAYDLAEEVAGLNHRLGLPAGLLAAGYKPVDVEEIAAAVAASRFNEFSPYQPTMQEARVLVADALG